MQQQPQSPQKPHLLRGLNARHIRFIALGSAIGTGLFYGSAAAIKAAGPAVLLAYLIGGAAVFIVMRALGEMAVRNPVPGAVLAGCAAADPAVYGTGDCGARDGGGDADCADRRSGMARTADGGVVCAGAQKRRAGGNRVVIVLVFPGCG